MGGLGKVLGDGEGEGEGEGEGDGEGEGETDVMPPEAGGGWSCMAGEGGEGQKGVV